MCPAVKGFAYREGIPDILFHLILRFVFQQRTFHLSHLQMLEQHVGRSFQVYRLCLPVHTLKKSENYYLAVFLVGAYQEILGDMHNLFGDTNAVHVSVTDKGYTIDQIIDGETVAEVLEYVQYEPKKLVRRLEIWVSKSIQSGKISLEEGKEFLNNYRSGLYGYTYFE